MRRIVVVPTKRKLNKSSVFATQYDKPYTLDQGIIAAFKKHFVKLTFKCILENDAITLT